VVFGGVLTLFLVAVIFLFSNLESPTPTPLRGSHPTTTKQPTNHLNTIHLKNSSANVDLSADVVRFDPHKRQLPSFCIDPSIKIPGMEDVVDLPLQPKFSGSHVTIQVPSGTSYYGAGEVCHGLLLNGRKVVTWNKDHKYDENSLNLYESHPYILAVFPDGSSFGIIFDTTYRLTMDLTSPTQIVASTEAIEFPVVIISKPNPIAVTLTLAKLTGYMPLPPKWSLGYHQSRWSYYPQSKVVEIANTFREKKIPCDVIWLDIHYMEGYRIFTFDNHHFPSPELLNQQLHEKNFHSVWMIDPGVKKEFGYFVYDQLARGDMAVKHHGVDYVGHVWPGACVFPDFTMEKTREWWSGLYADFMKKGIDGVWNDMNEPAVFNSATFTIPEDAVHRGYGGGDHAQFHNVYGMLMINATRDGVLRANPQKRPFVLSRANFLGGQRFGAMWTGDNQAKWSHLRLSIPMIINMGLSGQPFAGPDIGGFHDNATPKLFARWMGFGALFPFARGHTHEATVPHEPWSFTQDVEEACRIAINRRYILMPFIYTLFHEASKTGHPVFCPLFFLDPSDAQLRSEDRGFLLGTSLAVLVNVQESGNNIAEIHLPQNQVWYEISLESLEDKSDFVTTSLPALRIRGGSIIPTQPVVQSNMERTDSMTLLIALNVTLQAEGQLYLDEGENFSYQTGNYLLIHYYAHVTDSKLKLFARKEGDFVQSELKELKIVLYTMTKVYHFTETIDTTTTDVLEFDL